MAQHSQRDSGTTCCFHDISDFSFLNDSSLTSSKTLITKNRLRSWVRPSTRPPSPFPLFPPFPIHLLHCSSSAQLRLFCFFLYLYWRDSITYSHCNQAIWSCCVIVDETILFKFVFRASRCQGRECCFHLLNCMDSVLSSVWRGFLSCCIV